MWLNWIILDIKRMLSRLKNNELDCHNYILSPVCFTLIKTTTVAENFDFDVIFQSFLLYDLQGRSLRWLTLYMNIPYHNPEDQKSNEKHCIFRKSLGGFSQNSLFQMKDTFPDTTEKASRHLQELFCEFANLRSFFVKVWCFHHFQGFLRIF